MTVGVLIAPYADALTSTTSDLADAYDAETTMAASRLGVASWPVLRAVGTSLAATGEKRWLTALSVFGAQGIRTATGRSTLHRAPPSCATRPRSRRRAVQVAEMSHALKLAEPSLRSLAGDWFSD